MNREGKGKSIQKYIDTYCIMDLETTGVFVNSAEIIEISILKVKDGKVSSEYSTLVNPKMHIPSDATAVNNITDDMVKEAPEFKDIVDDVIDFIEDLPIVGYNNAGFDMNIIYDKLLSIKNIIFSNDYIDVLHAVRRSLPMLENAKLETVSKYYSLDTEGEHRALKDCYLTKEVYEKLYKDFGDAAFRSSSMKGDSIAHKQRYTNETIALQNLQMLLENIIEDGQVTLLEFAQLREWIEEHRDLQGIYPFDRVFNAIDKVLEDGIVTEEELEELQQLFVEYTDPVKNLSSCEKISAIKGKHICITGEFKFGSRKEVTEYIEKYGGIIDNNTKKTTDYLVVGEYGSAEWKTGNYGSKIQKALEYIDKGIEIKIYEEKDFIPCLEECVDNEVEEVCGTWKEKVSDVLEKMILELELPENSLYLMANKGRSGEKITSYSVCIYEPDYPLSPNAKRDAKRNSIVLNIKENSNDLEFIINVVQGGDIELPSDAVRKELKSDAINVHVLLAKNSNSIADYVKRNTEYALANYESKAPTFGCCSRFNECSDAKKCTHENKLYSKACSYRINLENGKIFYGKNRNV